MRAVGARVWQFFRSNWQTLLAGALGGALAVWIVPALVVGASRIPEVTWPTDLAQIYLCGRYEEAGLRLGPTAPPSNEDDAAKRKGVLDQINAFSLYSYCLFRTNRTWDYTIKILGILAILVTTISSALNDYKWSRWIGVISGAIAVTVVSVQSTFPTAERAAFNAGLVEDANAIVIEFIDNYETSDPHAVQMALQALRARAVAEQTSSPEWVHMPALSMTRTA